MQRNVTVMLTLDSIGLKPLVKFNVKFTKRGIPHRLHIIYLQYKGRQNDKEYYVVSTSLGVQGGFRPVGPNSNQIRLYLLVCARGRPC